MKVPFRIRHLSPSNTCHPECAFCAKDLLQYFDFIAVGLVLLRTGQSVLVESPSGAFQSEASREILRPREGPQDDSPDAGCRLRMHAAHRDRRSYSK